MRTLHMYVQKDLGIEWFWLVYKEAEILELKFGPRHQSCRRERKWVCLEQGLRPQQCRALHGAAGSTRCAWGLAMASQREGGVWESIWADYSSVRLGWFYPREVKKISKNLGKCKCEWREIFPSLKNFSGVFFVYPMSRTYELMPACFCKQRLKIVLYTFIGFLKCNLE